MKRALLKIGHGICFLLTVIFLAAAYHFLQSDFGTFLVAVILATGPALGMLACRNELNEQRSWKVLLCFGLWIVVITLLCIIFI